MSKNPFPKTLHVVQNGEGTDDAFLMIVDLDKDDLQDYADAPIASYTKVTVDTLRIPKPFVE